MPRQQRSIQTSREGRISLAIASYHNNPKQSIRALAKAFDIPQSTLHTRIHGVQPRSETVSVNRKLSPIEEQSLVQWILDLDRRGFPPHIIDVRRMADALLAARGQDPPPQPIGKKWFKLVEETRQTYGVLYQDIYNFDETRFAIGVAGTSKVVTSSERVGRAVVVQPGNREWVTAIECVNASSWCLPPLVILSGKVHQSSWYNRLPLDWVKHFNHYTAARTARVYRLLVLDGHSSHATPEFDQYCAKNKIINLCMPPHTSHLLQPLDVSCFSPLKRAYGCEIEKLACQGVYHIDKIDFLTVYQQIRPIVFTQQNIQAGFQATGLLAMQSAVILAEENKKLRAENQRQRQKQEQQRQYIASSGVLQAQQAQQIATEAERVVMGGDQNQTGERRQRAPPTCTKCHVQEHTRNSCRAR
ncbi:hypothetical protein PtrM4_122730 [Pyrenophora tritici-repentis]|uniref:HTH CENPB-type domain-containing protein n=1 Tax=Pyrenophora tritici-repentis TaxID=45151 RepID=A0A834VNR4_9PLEO|nr:hypothetical protein PtrM4_122730 [Pyrenophora tritici-repentis]